MLIDRCFFLLPSRASGTVFVARSVSDSAMVAIKQMNLNKQPRKQVILNEIVVLKETQHPNIVNFVNAYLSHVELSVVMEYMEGGDLTDVIENNVTMREDQMAGIMLQVRPDIFSSLSHLGQFQTLVSSCFNRHSGDSTTFTRGRSSIETVSQDRTIFVATRRLSPSLSFLLLIFFPMPPCLRLSQE